MLIQRFLTPAHMKSFALFLSAASLLAFSAAGQVAARSKPAAAATHAPSPDEQLFTSLVQGMGGAIEKHDMTALGTLMAPDYVHYNPSNSSADRTEELAYLATWPPPPRS